MIAVITDPAMGGSFLSWTIHYLSGKDQSYSATAKDWINLPSNPVTESNAHKFDTNQVYNLKITQTTIEQLSSLDDKNQTIYCHPSPFVLNQNKDFFDLLSSSADKVVLLTLNSQFKLYYSRYKPRGDKHPSYLNRSIILTNPDDMINDSIEYYHADLKKQWGEQRLVNVWDRREFFALAVKLRNPEFVDSYFDWDIPHYRIDSLDMWTMFEHNLTSLFEYLEIDLVEERYPSWLDIYNQWKKLHSIRMRFCCYYDTIIEYTIRGRDFDLTHLELDIMQEAFILRGLMFRHRLKLKSWQLKKFVNTRQLHELLEPCCYNLDDPAFNDWCRRYL